MKRVILDRPCSARRGGFLLVSVLITSLIVSVLGLSAISTARFQTAQKEASTCHHQAQTLALSAIEWGLATVNSDASWRTNYTSGAENSHNVTGSETMSFTLTDEDGNLADDTTDFVTLTGIGYCGKSRSVYRVVLMPKQEAIDSLSCGMVSDGDCRAKNASNLCIQGMLHSNIELRVENSTASITADCSSSGVISGTVYGTQVIHQADRQLPGSDVCEYYIERGVQIPYSSLTAGSGFRMIENEAISPELNPYNTGLSAEGIYVIDCQNQVIRIQNSRLKCTLVLLNVGDGSGVESAVNWSPGVDHYPALIVEGDFEIDHSRTPLSEADLSHNFNPTGFPYAGATDSTQDDTYPSVIRGLIHISGGMALPTSSSISEIEGVLLMGDFEDDNCLGDLFLQGRETYALDPPPGFRKGSQMEIIPGTWRAMSANSSVEAI